MSRFFNFNEKLVNLMTECEKSLTNRFKCIDEILEHNSYKVSKAFIDLKISAAHFNGTSGYGYDDAGRDKIDALYAKIFDSEDAIVRHSFASGTHALSVALFGVLRPNDTILSLTGLPYDTLLEVIGVRGNASGSLKDFGVFFDMVDIFDHSVDEKIIAQKIKSAKVVYIQRSRGYSNRPCLVNSQIEKWVSFVKNNNKSSIILVDNCYGEFVEKDEPTSRGVDLIVGSLIKNPGGGIADTGGYIVGKRKLVDLAANSLTAPGIGREVGCTLDQNKKILLGLYFAPSVVASALKVSALASEFFYRLGFECSSFDKGLAGDIISVIKLKSENAVLAFCRGIQKGSPIDSYVTPLPWNMPGYDNKIIMAAGTFTQGASIEISADGPIKPPYNVYLQGGICYHSSKVPLLFAAQELFSEGLISF